MGPVLLPRTPPSRPARGRAQPQACAQPALGAHFSQLAIHGLQRSFVLSGAELLQELFDNLDISGNGSLDAEELRPAFTALSDEMLAALQDALNALNALNI